jgi:hypothetical protein
MPKPLTSEATHLVRNVCPNGDPFMLDVVSFGQGVYFKIQDDYSDSGWCTTPFFQLAGMLERLLAW